MDAITRAQKHIDTLEPAVSGSGGHAATFRACRILVNDYNLSLDEAWPILLSFNARCEPPWNEKELRRKLEDAARRPKGNYGTDKSQGRKKPEPTTLPPSKRIKRGSSIIPLFPRQHLRHRSGHSYAGSVFTRPV